MYNNFFI